jgi:hypothetical protein
LWVFPKLLALATFDREGKGGRGNGWCSLRNKVQNAVERSRDLKIRRTNEA